MSAEPWINLFVPPLGPFDEEEHVNPPRRAPVVFGAIGQSWPFWRIELPEDLEPEDWDLISASVRRYYEMRSRAER